MARGPLKEGVREVKGNHSVLFYLHLWKLTKHEKEPVSPGWCGDTISKGRRHIRTVEMCMCFTMNNQALHCMLLHIQMFTCEKEKTGENSLTHCNSAGQSPNLCQSVCLRPGLLAPETLDNKSGTESNWSPLVSSGGQNGWRPNSRSHNPHY